MILLCLLFHLQVLLSFHSSSLLPKLPLLMLWVTCGRLSLSNFLYKYQRSTPFTFIITFTHIGMMKTFKFDQVLEHDKTQDCWLIIQGKVYDVTPFMEDHPGGAEVLLAATGKDATADFEDIGHSDDAVGMMGKYCIGKLEHATDVPPKRTYAPATFAADNKPYKTSQLAVKILQFLVPLFLFTLALAVRSYAKN